MAASGRLCDICEARDMAVFATDWCPECEQGLCESCKSHHSAIKSSKNHATIPVVSFDKLPSAVKKIKNDCSEHGARLEYFCSHHEVPCCVECMKTTHSGCRHLTPMHKVVEHFKTSNALSDFDQTLSDLVNNLNTLIKDRFSNISLLADERDKCLKDIADTKRNVIAHLDQLEMKLKTEIDDLHGEHLQSIEELINEFKLLETNVAKIQEESDVINQYASDFQLFMSFRELENTVKSTEKDVQSLIKKGSAKKISISFSQNVELANETLLPSLGNVNVITKESDIKLVNHRVKHAQLFTIGTSCINKIQLKPVFENVQIPIGKDSQITIWSNCFLSNGRLAILDELNNRLLIFKDNGDHDRNILLSFMPNYIASITDNEIAVSQNSSNEISIINITNSVVDRSFVVNHVNCNNIYAFSFRKKQFLLTVLHIGFFITDVEGNILSEIPYNVSDILFAVLLNDKIYFSQHSKNRIVCCDSKGNEIFEFKDKKLDTPLGVACTDTNVLLITGYHSKNIYALSNTGKDFKELYCNNYLSGARAISYDSSKQQLLVTTQRGQIFLYDLSY